MTRRVLMLGLDALEVSLLDRFCDAGELPNIKAFRDGGLRFGVGSDGEVLHGSVWPTFASGTGPGTHGVYFWTQWIAEEQRHLRNDHPSLRFAPFWAGFPAAGKRATVVDLPYVPLVAGPGMRGAMGWGLHDEVVAASTPEGFREGLNKRFGVNPLSFDTVEPHNGKAKLAMARRLRLGVRRRAALVEGLARDGEWDLLISTFSELHMAGHYLAADQQLSEKTDNVKAMAAILRPLDAALPGIVEAAGPECDVFLFGLHGMRPQVDFSQFGRQVVDLVMGRAPVDTDARPDLLRRVRDLIPGPVHRWVWSRIPARVRAARQGQLSVGGSDVAGEPLFSTVHDASAAFRLNVRGRERDGVLAPEETERVLADLRSEVEGMQTEDGRRAFGPFVLPQVRWPGARAHRLPDAMAVPNVEVASASRLVTGDGRVLTSERKEARNGVHTGLGFCVVRPGGPFTPLRDSVDAKDFAPTVLRLLGVAPEGELEGEAFVE